MDVPELLRQAASRVPSSATSGTGWTVADANEYLGHYDWEAALDILIELGDAARSSQPSPLNNDHRDRYEPEQSERDDDLRARRSVTVGRAGLLGSVRAGSCASPGVLECLGTDLHRDVLGIA